MRVTRFLIVIALFRLCLSTAAAGENTIVILHTNDIHASFVPHDAFWVRATPKPMVGGFQELAATIDSIKSLHPSALLVDAGDVMTGNPIADIEYRGAQGGLLFEMMNRIGYEAWCPGNHDLDISQANLRALTAIATFPTLSANLVDSAGRFPVGNRACTIIKQNGLRIGIFGLISQALYSLVNQNNLTGIRVLSPVETAQRLIDTLRPQTDLVIALTHEGVDDDSALAAGVTGLDVIIGGHSHTRRTTPIVVNDVIIAQAGSNCENLGVLELTVDDHHVKSHTGRLLQLWAGRHRASGPLVALVDSVRHEIQRQYGEIIATLRVDWKRQNGESNIGNFITGAQQEAAGAQVGFTNTHGIRADVPAGPLTRQTLYEVLPFRNVLVTFQLSGAQLRQVMQYSLSKRSAILSTGISCRFHRTADNEVEILDLRVQGRPVEDDGMYVCAANDFLVGDAKRYLGLEIERPVFLKQTVFEAVEKAARKTGVIESTIEHRITEVK